MMFGIATFTPAGAFAALTAIIGGIVLLGSNSTTWTELETDRFERETERAALIGRLPLRLVGEGRATLH
jgi:hypothetical protein